MFFHILCMEYVFYFHMLLIKIKAIKDGEI